MPMMCSDLIFEEECSKSIGLLRKFLVMCRSIATFGF